MNYALIINILFPAFLILVSIGFIAKKEYGKLIEIGIVLSAYIMFAYLQHRMKFQIESHIILLVAITASSYIFLGEYINLYEKSKHFDRYLHLFGSFSFAKFAFSLLQNLIKQPLPRPYDFILVISLGISIGVLFEIFEFIMDKITKSRHQKGLQDTDVDLICDVIGSIFAAVFV